MLMKNEKNILKNHVDQIASSVLNKHGIENYEITISTEDNCIDLDVETWCGDYICIIKFSKEEFCLEIKNAFTKFLNKPIYTSEGKFIFWFEGESSNDQINKENEINVDSFSISDATKIDKLKTDTRLPKWLDNFIFNTQNARYSPDFKRYSTNLEYTKEEVEVYLGTYFPRSYAESFCIMNDLMQNEDYFNTIKNKNTISILDIGSGTGGNLIGLLYAFRKSIYIKKLFKITVVDGNELALKYLKTIVEAFAEEYKVNIDLTVVNKVIGSIREIETVLQEIAENELDWILSFKMVCEIIQKENNNVNSYYEILDMCLPKLSEFGLMLLLDITTKLPNTNYIPLLLNKQANIFLTENKGFKTLSPICCGHYAGICNTECFYQQTFRITHKEKRQDISKVAYRIIGNSNFVNSLLKNLKKGNSIIKWRSQNNKYIAEQSCLHTLEETEFIDAYKLH